MSTESMREVSQERLTEQQIAEQLVEQAKTDGVEPVGPGGLTVTRVAVVASLNGVLVVAQMLTHLGLTDLTKADLETALEVVISLSAKGLTTGEISALFAEVWGVDGERDILGLWVGAGGEGAKYWHQVLTRSRTAGSRTCASSSVTG